MNIVVISSSQNSHIAGCISPRSTDLAIALADVHPSLD